MYEAHWNILEKPFQNTTNPKHFFYAETHEEAYIRMLYSVTESKGLMLLTGDGGCGKTFVCKVFFQKMLEQGHNVAFITNPDLDPVEFLQKVLCEYGLEYRNKTKVELLKDLQQFVANNTSNNITTILMVDEVQLIDNSKTLEEIRLLLNFESDGRFPLSIILSGKPEFVQTMREVPSLEERVGIQHQLKPLNCKTTGEYIYHRMNKSGCSREVFNTDAIKEIFHISGGVPRQINHICDLALLLGYGSSSVMIDRALVLEAVEDLKGVMSSSDKN